LNLALERVFYEGRHINFTVLVATQKDTEFKKGLRENAFVSFFCSKTMGENVLSKLVCAKTLRILSTDLALIFNGEQENKAVFVRGDDDSIYTYRCERITNKFKFGSHQVLQLIDRLKLLEEEKKRK
jgi:hypothetical protein